MTTSRRPNQLDVALEDLNTRPAVSETFAPNDKEQITIGDLHGNALKLFYFLVKYGVVEATSEQYERFKTLYYKDVHDMTREDIHSFNALLQELTYHPEAVATLRLIGDEFADRGNNDFFTLALINALIEKEINIDVLLSNHSEEFVYYLEKKHPRYRGISGSQRQSLTNLTILVNARILSLEEIDAMYSNYIKTVNAISYTMSEDQQSITLYTHAASRLDVIKYACKKLGVEYQDDTALNLAKSIDRLNDSVRAHLADRKLSTKYSYDHYLISHTYNPLFYLMWNRDHNASHMKRPHEFDGKSYKVSYVHGHSYMAGNVDHLFQAVSPEICEKLGYEPYYDFKNDFPDSSAHIYNLDGALGHQGMYNDQDGGPSIFRYSHAFMNGVLHSQEMPRKELEMMYALEEKAEASPSAVGMFAVEAREADEAAPSVVATPTLE